MEKRVRWEVEIVRGSLYIRKKMVEESGGHFTGTPSEQTSTT